MTLSEANKALNEVQNLIEKQGRIVNDRLLSKERQLKELVKHLEGAEAYNPDNME